MSRPAPSADLLDRLARRFPGSPVHAAWRARVVGDVVEAVVGPDRPGDTLAGGGGEPPPDHVLREPDVAHDALQGSPNPGRGDRKEGLAGVLQELPAPAHSGVIRVLDRGLQAGEDADRLGWILVVGHATDSRPAPSEKQARHVPRHVPEHVDGEARSPTPRGGHTELALERLAVRGARIRTGAALPAVWSA
jgi:hypothetical protein